MKLTKILKFSRSFACSIVLVAPVLVSAHTALKESTPGDEAIIKAAPGHIDLVFNGPVKLVKLELMGVGHEMPTNFEAQTDAIAAYRVETPGMHPGQFIVNWAAIGADGHTITNSFSFSVDPDAAE
jgi:methionine-rich copper-binding protein CopC